MKTTFIALLCMLCPFALFAQQHSLEKLWQTDSTLNIPESVLYVADSKILFVSNSENISKVSLDGDIVKQVWVTGLTATKGLGIYNGLLYAAELSNVAVIDIHTNTIVKRIRIDGAGMLNDITIDPQGIVYVSDTRTNKIHRIENGVATVYLENMEKVNGLLAVGDVLYALTAGKLQKIDVNKHQQVIAEGFEGNTDGLVQVKENEFLVSCWQGTIYYVYADGSKQVLLDTRDQKINTADLGYNPSTRTVYVPTFFRGTVVAYKLK